jgi:hypothetical protein
MSSGRAIKIQINVVAVGADSFRGMIADVYDILDRIESGVVDTISLRAEVDRIKARHRDSMRADFKKSTV